MFDESQQCHAPLSLEKSNFTRLAVVMPGFDSVTMGNDEYMLLTPQENEYGFMREYFQLPNDSTTVRELMKVMGPATVGEWIPFDSWLLQV